MMFFFSEEKNLYTVDDKKKGFEYSKKRCHPTSKKMHDVVIGGLTFF